MKILNPFYLLLLIEVLGFQEISTIKRETFTEKCSKIDPIYYKKTKLNRQKTAFGMTGDNENSKDALPQGFTTYLYQYKKRGKHFLDELYLMVPDLSVYRNYDLPYPKNYKYIFDNNENVRCMSSEIKNTCSNAKIRQDCGGPLAF